MHKKGLIESTEEKIRKRPLSAKDYEITFLGIVEFYLDKRKKSKSSPTEFHHSKEGQEIVDRIIKIFFNIEEKTKTENLFIKTLRISPSLVESLPTLGDLIKPRIIKNSRLFKEMFRHYGSLSRINMIFDKWDEKKMHLNFLKEEFPLKILADDFERYPDDYEINNLFSKALMEKYISIGNKSIKEKKEIFATVLKAVRENIVDPKKSIDEQWEKFEDFEISEEGKLLENIECWKHVYLYLPPGGDPRLLCDGKCLVEKSSN